MGNETKFTPGPWFEKPSLLEEGEWIVGDETRMWDICILQEKFSRTPEQAKANARLIAAAPDLLKALKLLVKQRAHKAGTVEGALHLWDEASAAILKATTPNNEKASAE